MFTIAESIPSFAASLGTGAIPWSAVSASQTLLSPTV